MDIKVKKLAYLHTLCFAFVQFCNILNHLTMPKILYYDKIAMNQSR